MPMPTHSTFWNLLNSLCSHAAVLAHASLPNRLLTAVSPCSACLGWIPVHPLHRGPPQHVGLVPALRQRPRGEVRLTTRVAEVNCMKCLLTSSLQLGELVPPAVVRNIHVEWRTASFCVLSRA